MSFTKNFSGTFYVTPCPLLAFTAPPSTGIPNPPSVTAYLQQSRSHPGGRHSLSELGKDALSSQAVISVTEHLFDILETCGELYEDCKWIKRWQRLSRRYTANS